jgi:FSR family fosmidomycin resistance protein-like MFS transporter
MNGKRLFAASYGHFAIDLLNSSIAIILTAVVQQFDLSVSQIGVGAMIYTFAASLTQPLFGIVVDKLRGRYVTGLGILWTMTFYALAPFMPNYTLLVTCLAVGALGSGAFHPAGMVNATMAGGKYPTTATSIFFVLGQSGLALGPLLCGVVLQNYGLAGLPYLALTALPAVIFAMIYLHEPFHDHDREAAPAPTAPTAPRGGNPLGAAPVRLAGRGFLVGLAFVLLITLRSTTQQGFITLLPKYFADQGLTPATFGAMLSVLGLAGALGTFVGGWLGDRFNRRMVIFVSMMLGAGFSTAMLHTGGWLYVAAALAAGLVMNVPHSILLIMAQRLLPRRKGMIGGAVLGFMFASGAATTGLGSWIADYVGLPAVLTVFALAPIGAGLCALLLPSTRGTAAPTVPAHKPATSAAD